MALAAKDINIEVEPDGSVIVDLSARRASVPSVRQGGKHDENLAETIARNDLSVIESELHEGIDADVESRKEWVNNYNDGLKMLGLLMEKPGANATGGQATSRVRHPLLAQAIVKFQAQTNGEMLPANGPVKVKNDGPLDAKLAMDLEKDLNYFFTKTASEYYPDTDRGLFYLGYGGTIFKKVYKCPLRKRPVSECVYLPDLIISNDATDIPNASRVTHRIEMSTMRIERLQRAGYFADVPLMQPSQDRSETQKAVGLATGIRADISRPKDVPHTLYEVRTELDLTKHFREKGQDLEEPAPYRVTIDRDSRQIYEIRRDWTKNDLSRTARRTFFKWGLIPGIGYLDLGYLNLLGNHALAGTALERVLIDAGVYSIFPAGLRLKGTRLETNQIRPAPGEYVEVDGGGAQKIGDAMMPLPFKGPAGEVLQLLQHIEGQADKMTGHVEIATAEGVTAVPVGTIIAAIEQATQVQTAVHRRLHNAQGEEIRAIRDLLCEDEEGIKLLKRPDETQNYTREQLAHAGLDPRSDPNVPAHIHRIMQATVVETLFTSHPELYDGREVQRRILEIARIEKPEGILLPPPDPNAPPPPDPAIEQAKMLKEVEDAKIAQKKEEAAGKLGVEEKKVGIAQAEQSGRLQAQREDEAAKRAAEQAQTQQENERAEREAAVAASKAQTEAAAVTHKAQTEAQVAIERARGEAQVDAQKSASEERDANERREDEARLARERLNLEGQEAEKDRESEEAIQAMHDQTKLIIAKETAKGEKTSPRPARDTKAGP